MRIKVVAGKGNKDRYTLLSSFALTTVRQYFLNPINNIISLVSGFSLNIGLKRGGVSTSAPFI